MVEMEKEMGKKGNEKVLKRPMTKKQQKAKACSNHKPWSLAKSEKTAEGEKIDLKWLFQVYFSFIFLRLFIFKKEKS